jgi:hypothetical protein
LGSIFKLEVTHIFGLLFTKVKIDQRIGWVMFWAIFSQTHLVTLVRTRFTLVTFARRIAPPFVS